MSTSSCGSSTNAPAGGGASGVAVRTSATGTTRAGVAGAEGVIGSIVAKGGGVGAAGRTASAAGAGASAGEVARRPNRGVVQARRWAASGAAGAAAGGVQGCRDSGAALGILGVESASRLVGLLALAPS